MKKPLKEWFINAPWGKIALISWGDPNGEPILLVHGRQDSAATFIPLLELLPDTYHYVAVDLPGNGLSRPATYSCDAAKIISCCGDSNGRGPFDVEHIYIYSAFNGRRVRCRRCVYLDSAPAVQRLLIADYSAHYKSFYAHYYDNYERINTDDRIFTKQAAIKAVMKARDMNERQAEIILSRNLRKIGPDQYKLSWDKRQKILAPLFNTVEYYYEVFNEHLPPTLLISAKDFDGGYQLGKEPVKDLIAKLMTNENFQVVYVEGGHDVHFTKPERVASFIISFLKGETPKSKL